MLKSLEARARLPRLGVIRLGVQVPGSNGKRAYPKEVEYFVLPPEVQKLLDDPRPTRLPVLLPSDNPDRVLQTSYIRYSGRLMTLKCDGERFTELPVGGGELVGACKKEEGKPCPCGAKALGRLNVILVDGPLGIYQVPIGGEQRLVDLYGEMEVYRRAFGRLTNILFYLERVPTEVQIRKEDGSRMARTGYPVHLRCDTTARRALQAQGIDIASLPGGTGAPALPPAAVEEDEHEAVADLGESPEAPAESVAEPRALDPHPSARPGTPGWDPNPPRTGDAARTEGGLGPASAPSPPAADEEWDLSRLFREAERCGLSAVTFRGYLEALYAVDLDNLPPTALAQQGAQVRAALADEKSRTSYKLTALQTIKAAAQKKGGRR